MNCLLRLLWGGLLVCAPAWAQPQVPPVPVDKPVDLPAAATLPQFPRVASFSPEAGLPSVRSADIEVIHAKSPLSGFVIRVGGQPFAVGIPPNMIGYVQQGELHWLDFTKGSLQQPNVSVQRNQIQSTYQARDADGATWKVTQRFRPQRVPGTIEIQTDVTIDQDRPVALLQMLAVYPGVGSFGTNKDQGLFAGLEYLENEPSSSQADVIGPAANRQVPDSLKITFPLMSIQASGRYLGVTWQMRPHFSALFDSPDRLFQSGGHVMGLLFPGSNGKDRVEGSLLPRGAVVLHANEVLSLRATLFGGLGTSVVPAIQHYVKLRPFPPTPEGLSLVDYVSLAAGGWLDSKIREGNLVRHALASGGFKAQPAADAALWMDWLAVHDSDLVSQARLESTATNVLSAVQPADLNSAGVGHIRYPVESLVIGNVEENAEQARQRGKALLTRFEADGSVKYHPNSGGPDLGKTHSSNEASGFASRVVLDLLESAMFSGDRELVDAGLRELRALDKFHNGVPRGAQTWECPLHTPDILASAQMVRAYTVGYQLSDDSHFLDEARYWAWTGVPFVYLVNPTEAPVGLYSTIAVFGATQWKAPVWFGLPVQWCGLVYADALYRFARHDPKGPWKQIADGITVSGIQQSWTQQEPDYQGLLPDSFVLRDQKRNGPAINPATVEACAARHYDSRPVYDFHYFPTNGVFVHAPGQIGHAREAKGHVSFQVESWVKLPFFVLINGISQQPRLKINGQVVECASPHQYLKEQGRVILRLNGPATVDLSFQAIVLPPINH